MPYYILSLKHTRAKDKFFTLWRPNNAGYCYSTEKAGQYPQFQEGYHNSCSNMPITYEQMTYLSEKVMYEGQEIEVLRNTLAIRKRLGLKIVNKELVKA